MSSLTNKIKDSDKPKHAEGYEAPQILCMHLCVFVRIQILVCFYTQECILVWYILLTGKSVRVKLCTGLQPVSAKRTDACGLCIRLSPWPTLQGAEEKTSVVPTTLETLYITVVLKGVEKWAILILIAHLVSWFRWVLSLGLSAFLAHF